MRAAMIVVALFLAGLGAAAQFGKMSVLYDVLAGVYAGQGAVALGLMVSVVGFVGLVFGTTAGLLVARIGPRRAIVAAMLLGAAVSAVQAVLPPFGVMMALRVAEGVSHLAIVVVGPTVIAAVSAGRHQGLAMTVWSTFFGLTYAILALVGPPVVAFGGAPALFLGHAAWMGAIAAVLALLLPPDPAAPPQRAHRNLLADHVAIYASPRVAAPALGFVFYTALYVALLTLLPPLLPEPLRAPVAAGVPLVSIAVSLVLGVRLLPVLGPVRLVQAGFAVACLGAVGFALSPGWPPGLAMAATVIGGALGLVQGASFAAIPALNATDEDRARASGAVAQLGNVGTTTGTPVLAWLVAQMGIGAVAAFTLVLCLAGIAMHGWLARRRVRES